MSKDKIISLLVRITDRCKPFLVRILPIGLLRRAKKSMITSYMEDLDSLSFPPIDRSTFPDGINLIGFIRGEIGLGQSCRLVASGLEATDLPFTIYNYEQTSAMRFSDHSWDEKITNTVPYNINLIHINPYELPLAYLQLGNKVWDSHYNIAFWLWELEQFPADWCHALHLVDEIWTPSEFASASIRQVTDKPVRTIPYPISAPTDATCTRETFGLPEDKFLFLCMYDCNSTMERKNPMGALKAYKQAFSSTIQDVGLVIKVNNSQQKDLQLLRKEFEGYSNIFILADILDKPQVNSLIACVDAYISLHRAEGFGLVPAEAMLLGTPVIATNWSSNTEFMNSEVACMVDFAFISIEEDVGPYKKGNRWADPDIAQAADYMRKLYQEPEYARELSEKAQAYIQDHLSLERAAGLIKSRIDEIYEKYS
jgi:glycosyltransferase involved in cell wall biosynthesis